MQTATPPAPPESATPFVEEVRAMVAENGQLGAAREAVVFYGSSSIRLWSTLARDFAGWRVINRGFGGSTLRDCLLLFDRLVVPLQPRALVFYAGDNDLDQGATPEALRQVYEEFLRRVRARLGGLPVVALSVKPSPCRFWNHGNIRRANELLREASTGNGVLWLDVHARMLTEQGQPRREFFCEDALHLSPLGYALWTEAVRGVLPPP